MAKTSQRVLVIGAASGIEWNLRAAGFEFELAAGFSPGLERLSSQRFDLVVLDLSKETSPELEWLVKGQVAAPNTPFILQFHPAAERLGREALHLGAQDYVIQGQLGEAELVLVMRKAIDRYSAQGASRRDQHLLEILMNNIPDAIYFKDMESRFVRINQAHARRFNLPNPAMAIGKTDADFFSSTHAQQALEDERHAMRTGQALVGIEEMETWPDGSITWVSTTKMPLRDLSGKIVGTFGISRDITPRKKAELALAERTRQLQQKNEQIAEELKMARELQLAMLPQGFPCLPPYLPYTESALEFFSFFRPNGSVSGDFYDVVELSDSRVGIFICDVMGHDVRAALITAMMRSLVQDLSHGTPDPGQLLAQINRALAGVFKLSGATMFATAMYLVADVETGELRYASAAHPDALYVRRDALQVDTLRGSRNGKGPALGLFDDAVFPTCRRMMGANDLILLFTDGLVEAEGRNNECYSEERLRAAVQRRIGLPVANLFEELIQELQQFCGANGFNDDVSVLGVGVRRIGPPPNASCPLKESHHESVRPLQPSVG